MYSFAPLPDLTLTHYGWWVWVSIVLAGLGPWINGVGAAFRSGDSEEINGGLIAGGLVLIITGMVWLGSYAHVKPENIKYTATLEGFTNTKDGMMVSYRLDQTGNIVMKEVVAGHEYPKHIVMYKNKNKS